MADNRFFTNTHNIISGGRQNYLRIDDLEDPLFTSFTFDIDYTSSPLFYTIKDYDYSNREGLAANIDQSLKEMYLNNMGKDQGYDILPMLSANFINQKKLGFGLQQNVYTDLPLYGATEYIYMVDRRNAIGEQNDIRYDSVGGEGGGISNSYKLGDSIEELVSTSDMEWTQQKQQSAKDTVDACDEIINNGDAKKKCDEYENNMNKCIDDYEKTITSTIKNDTGEPTSDGDEYLDEDGLQDEIDKLKKISIDFENFKSKIVDWVNNTLSGYQKEATDLYSGNKWAKEVIRYGDILFCSEEKLNEYKESLKKSLGSDYVKYIYGNDEESIINKNIKLFSKVVDKNTSVDTGVKGTDSFLVEEDGNKLYVRSSKIIEEFSKTLDDKYGDLKTKIKDDQSRIRVLPLGDLPEWTSKIVDIIIRRNFAGDNNDDVAKNFGDNLKSLMRYRCEMDDFVNFSSSIVDENNKKLSECEKELESIRKQAYGTDEDGNARDKSNPSPDSVYGQYISAKEQYENCAYKQAENTKKAAESEFNELENMIMEKENLDKSDNEPVITQPTPQNTFDGKTSVAPQTVLDMLGFISGMKKMITEYPYIMQSITGLDVAYNKHYGIKDPYLGSGDDKITITCWESLDLRVSSMFNRYLNAVYDRQYRRERVPVNLRRFNCSIYVHDVRHFAELGSEYQSRISELVEMHYSMIEFKFYDCEIVPEETGNIFDNISNEAPSEMKKTNFTFTYGNCVVNFVPNSITK